MLGSVLGERQVSARPVVVLEVLGEDAAQMSLARDDDVVETFSPDGPNQALHVRIRPRRPRRGEHFLDSERLYMTAELVAIDDVAIAQEVASRGIVWESFADLLGER